MQLSDNRLRGNGAIGAMCLRISLSLLLISVAVQLGTAYSACAAPAAAHKQAAGAKQASPSSKTPPKGPDLTGAYNAYLARLRSKVQNSWDYPPGKFHVVLQALVNSDGSVGSVTVTSTPHGDAAEKAASSAFSLAQPLEPLPEKSTPTVRITMNFDSSYDQHGDSSSNFTARLDPIQPPKLQAVPVEEGSKGSPEAGQPAAGGGAGSADGQAP